MATRNQAEAAKAQAHRELLGELTPAATDLILALSELQHQTERVQFGADSETMEDLRAETDTMTKALLQILVAHDVVTSAVAKDAMDWISE